MQIRRLLPADDRSAFESGDEHIDRFFRQFAGQNQFKHHVGTTSVGVIDSRIVAFAAISPASIDIEELPETARKRLPRYPLPVLRLARMGVTREMQRKGLGDELMAFVFDEAIELQERFGCVGVVVDAKEEARSFYARYGFSEFSIVQGSLAAPGRITPMFLGVRNLAGYGT
jgi:GNAT superfamily N-acetyltransferase